MNEIKRFNHQVCEYPGGIFSEMNQEADGDYVHHSDHKAEVARLRAEVEKIRGYEVAPLEAKVAGLRAELQNAAKAALDAVVLSCEKEREADALRAEVEAYRKDAERYRWLRDDAMNGTRHDPAVLKDGPTDCCDFMFGDELDAAIDAAMGASA